MKQLLARAFLRLTGWTSDGGRPDPKRYVLIAAPHTSNWDLPYLLAFAWLYNIQISWMSRLPALLLGRILPVCPSSRLALAGRGMSTKAESTSDSPVTGH